jgi:hypothetical protein
LKARSIPVITALKSPIVEGFFIKRVISHSVRTAEVIPTQVRKIARHPKNMYEATIEGTSAIITHIITLGTEPGWRMWGEVEIWRSSTSASVVSFLLCTSDLVKGCVVIFTWPRSF